MNLHFLDVAATLLLVVAFGHGLRSGMIREVLGLLGVLAGIYLALHLHHEVLRAMIEQGWLREGVWGGAVAFLVLFVMTLAVFRWGAWLLTQLMSLGSMGLLNRLGGAVVAVMQMGVVLGVLGWGLEQYGWLSEETLESTTLFRRLVAMGEQTVEWAQQMGVIERMHDVWRQVAEQLSTVSSP